MTGVLIEKLPDSWKYYKQQLKHNNKQMSLVELIKHIIIEDIGRKEIEEARAKALASRTNLLQGKKKSMIIKIQDLITIGPIMLIFKKLQIALSKEVENVMFVVS